MSQLFDRLIKQGNPAGSIIAANRFLVTVTDLPNATIGAQVLTENDHVGLINMIDHDQVTIQLLTSESAEIGEQVVVQNKELIIHPSKSLKGRVVDPLLRSLDGEGSILSQSQSQVFALSPPFAKRALLNKQMETGVTIVDSLFPIVRGQRIAVLGDGKSGKTSFTAQAAVNQARQGTIVVFVLIAKRRSDVEQLIDYLKEQKVFNKCVLIVADSLSALPMAYVAPYSGCAIAEYFWQQGEDVMIIYDDLSNHAKVLREITLVAGGTPGRESYPGDMFYAHSSLLERAGKVEDNKGSLTALPIMSVANNDITSHLATSLISITDGQLVFDTEELQRGSTPPINTGISVSRIGGRAQEKNQKALAQDVFKTLGDYRQASELAQFGQELPEEYVRAITLGDRVREIFNQEPNEFYNLYEQQILLKAAFLAEQNKIDTKQLKLAVKNVGDQAKATESYEDIAQKLISHGSQK